MPKPVQIAVTDINGYYNRTEIAALCDDGSIWLIQNEKDKGCTDWKQLPEIPSNKTMDSSPYRELIQRE